MKSNANPAELSEIERLMASLREIDRKISTTENAGEPVEHRFDQVAAELDAAEAIFNQHGFYPQHPHPTIRNDLRHQALIGAVSVAGGRNFLISAGQERLRRQFEAQGATGMTESAKALALQELRRERRKQAAILESYWRTMESNGLPISRPDDLVEPEFYLADQPSLLRIAAGSEYTA